MKGANRFRRFFGANQVVFATDELVPGEKVDQRFRDRDDGVAGTSSSVRYGPCLVQIVVHRVYAHGAEVDPSGDGVHVGPVHVDEPAGRVYFVGDGLEIGFQDT